jgi:hypothetical protein
MKEIIFDSGDLEEDVSQDALLPGQRNDVEIQKDSLAAIALAKAQGTPCSSLRSERGQAQEPSVPLVQNGGVPPTTPSHPPQFGGMGKSGASTLEILPIGFKYCSLCTQTYPKDYEKDVCHCSSESRLEIIEQGFLPGHYLILYNDKKKAISYFRLETEGSIFIGRSNERGSSRDIDVSVAWKHHYQQHASDPEEFKQKMGLLKGISRKHALIRFSKEEQKYVLFHLSDKNYTTIQIPHGEKRVRAPKNRSKIELQPDTIISLGNQQEFILMRYKVLSLSLNRL